MYVYLFRPGVIRNTVWIYQPYKHHRTDNTLDKSSTRLNEILMSEHNNTFLSRVFGVSSPDGDDVDDDERNGAELSNIVAGGANQDNEGSFNNRSSLVNSDSDSDSMHDSESSDDVNHHLLRNKYFNSNNFKASAAGGVQLRNNQKLADTRLQGGLDDDNDEEDDNSVPQSLLVEREAAALHKPKFSDGLQSILFEEDEENISLMAPGQNKPIDYNPSNVDDFKSTVQQRNTSNFTSAFSGGGGGGRDNSKPLLPLFNVSNAQVNSDGTSPAPNLKYDKKSIDNERIRRQRLGILSPREKALWLWANVENLDIFLQDVYNYYLKNGFYCILIKKATDLLTMVFIVYFSTYLAYCIDYSKLSGSKKLSEIHHDKCYKTQVSGLAKCFLFLFYGFVIIRTIQFWLIDLKKLKEMRNFFKYLLIIEENELQTISWQLIIKKLILLRDTNANGILISQDGRSDTKSDLNSKKRLTAHDIANRIMRKENYLVALYNKDILNFKLNVPLLSYLTKENFFLTKTLEWNINLCIIGFVFNNEGQFKSMFLKRSNRSKLSEELRKRFIICGALNIIIAPFLASYFILLNFFRFFYEFRSDPHLIGNREFSPYAEWKFREFNELYHFFKKRLHYSMESSNEYLNQFPKERVNLIMKFISFVSGALVTVLILLTVFDPDLSINFEITENKSVLFYIGILGSVWAVSHGSTSEETQNKIFDPEHSLKTVAEYTHYLPKEWEGRFHTEDVKSEFAELFQLKVALIAKEVLSILFIPFIFWFALPKSTDQVIDFFREFTVHVDGLGHVCSFAMFDVEKKNENQQKLEHESENVPKRQGKEKLSFQTNKPIRKKLDDLRDDYYNSSDNKMLKSYLHFVESYADRPETNLNRADGGNAVSPHPSSNMSMYFSKQLPFGVNRGRPSGLRASIYDPHEGINVGESMMRSRYRDNVPNRFAAAATTNNNMYNSINNFVGDESYLINLKTNDNGIAHERAGDNENGDGVLGLLNQFYKTSNGKKI